MGVQLVVLMVFTQTILFMLTILLMYFLSIVFNACIQYGHLPTNLMKPALFLSLKTRDISDKNNYRPIALVTATSKLFEICLLEILQMYLPYYTRSSVWI